MGSYRESGLETPLETSEQTGLDYEDQVDFSELDLLDVEDYKFGVPVDVNKNKVAQTEYLEPSPFEYQGVLLELRRIRVQSFMGKGKDLSSQIFIFSVLNGDKDIVQLHLTFTKNALLRPPKVATPSWEKLKIPEVTTSINKDKEGQYDNRFRGLGLGLYKKGLDMMEEQAVQGVVFKHKIFHRISMGLDPEKWDEMFKPILEERGYVEIGRGEWEKIYGKK